MPPYSHEEVVRFDISVDEVLVVNILYSPNHLVSQHQHCLHGEPPRAEGEEVLEARPEQVHHQHVVVALHTKPPNMRDPHASLITGDI